MPGDFHSHTNFSDGSSDIEELVYFAQKANLTHLAVSDHDTDLCINFAYKNPCIDKLTLVPAVELTCFDFKRLRRVHLLCYCPRLTDQMLAFFSEMKKRRNAATMQSLEELEQLYPQFSKVKALSFTDKSGVLYKTHLIRVLYEAGYTDGVYKQLYKELFGYPNGKVLHDPHYESVEAVLEIIKNSGGVAVLAHPSVYNSMDLVFELAENRKIDGVEVYHPRNKPQDADALAKLAKENDLIITGGSDFHGMHMAHPNPLGSYTTDDENINKIINLARLRGFKLF